MLDDAFRILCVCARLRKVGKRHMGNAQPAFAEKFHMIKRAAQKLLLCEGNHAVYEPVQLRVVRPRRKQPRRQVECLRARVAVSKVSRIRHESRIQAGRKRCIEFRQKQLQKRRHDLPRRCSLVIHHIQFRITVVARMVVDAAGMCRPVKQAERRAHPFPVGTVHRNNVLHLHRLFRQAHLFRARQERINTRHRLFADDLRAFAHAFQRAAKRKGSAQRIAIRRGVGDHRKPVVFLYERSNAAQRVLLHAARSFFMRFYSAFSFPVRPAVPFCPYSGRSISARYAHCILWNYPA